MKITLRLIFSLLLTTAAVVVAFSYFQTRVEESRLNEDLSLRARLVAKSFKEAIEPFIEQTDQPERIRLFIEKFRGHTRLIGTLVAFKNGEMLSFPDALRDDEVFQKETAQAVALNEPVEWTGKWRGKPVYFYALPIEKDGIHAGALGVVHDRSYIIRRIRDSWKRLGLTFSLLAFILSLTTLLVIRWSITGPIAKIADFIKKATGGEIPAPGESEKKGEIEKLSSAVRYMASNLKAARLDLAEQSRIANAEGAFWSKERLKDYLQTRLDGKRLFVIANREPYIHTKKGNVVECITPASGVVTALDPVMQATGGMWIGHGAGDADRENVDARDQLRVPPKKPSYTLKRVWLTEEEEKGYYYGFSNEGLWPLCHISHVRPIFRIEDWKQYKRVNEKFANSLLEELGDLPSMVLIQDYHFALLPKLIKEKRPDVKVALFWHIPWPNPEAFGICPWQEEILEGMLGADLIGFHTQFHCNNFLDTVDKVLESRIDWTTFSAVRKGETSYVRPFPISVAYSSDMKIDSAEMEDELKRIRREFGLDGKLVGIGVDRIDYTKGLLERFRALERVLEKYPDYRGKLVFVELGAPSRSLIPGYQDHLQEVEELVRKINEKFQLPGYVPILFLKEHHTHERISKFYKLADFCLVSSLHDGMNLVAKEFVAARSDESGVLILSRFTGVSQEFSSALQINPYDIESTAESIHQALVMPAGEKQERMRKLQSVVREYNVYRWAADMITGLVRSFEEAW